eukprot:866634-Amphidinium_carterae.1
MEELEQQLVPITSIIFTGESQQQLMPRTSESPCLSEELSQLISEVEEELLETSRAQISDMNVSRISEQAEPEIPTVMQMTSSSRLTQH